MGTTQNRGALMVTERRPLTPDVVEFTLCRPDGSRLPDWAPGAHIDLVLSRGVVRQYSLCGDRWDAHSYRIAVAREAEGRGGSIRLHDEVRVGDLVQFGGPRNNFRLVPAERYLFVGAGIGITPLLPMIVQAELLDVPWDLLYLGRSRSKLAYLDMLDRYGARAHVHCGDEAGRADLVMWRPTDPGTRVYACGPARLLDEVQSWPALPGGFPAKIERFSAIASEPASTSATFEVVATRSQVTVSVTQSESVVDALRGAGVDVLTSCSQGICGTCETAVLSGRPDHRDSLLDDSERARSDCMFPCVSRSLDSRLVLDI